MVERETIRSEAIQSMFTSHLTDFVECSGSKSSTVNSPHLVLSFIEGSKLCGIEKIFRFSILTLQDQPVISVSLIIGRGTSLRY